MPERAVAALAVVEDLDVVEDLGAQLVLGRPRAAVDESFLIVAKKLSATALSKQSPLLAIDCAMPALRACWPNASDTNWLPWSECQIRPRSGRRRASAICSASLTSSVRKWSAMLQPTIRRL